MRTESIHKIIHTSAKSSNIFKVTRTDNQLGVQRRLKLTEMMCRRARVACIMLQYGCLDANCVEAKPHVFQTLWHKAQKEFRALDTTLKFYGL